MKENKGLHDGHRDRLRKRFIENGMDSFLDHQAVELMLFYCIPRKDTNDMAHMLLDQFGSFSGLLDAPLGSLQKSGVSSHSALFIKLVSALCSRYYHDKYQKADDDVCMEDFVISRFGGIRENRLSLILLDSLGKLIFCDSVKETAQFDTDEKIKAILQLNILNNAVAAVVVDNRPNESTLPSEEDINMIVSLRKSMNDMGIVMMDYYIVSDNDCLSLSNTEEYENIFFD